MEKIIKGIIFMVPNYIHRKREFYSSERINRSLEKFGMKADDNEPLVETWAFNEVCDNFSRHGFDYPEMFGEEIPLKDLKPEDEEGEFPEYIPYSVLKDLKENDTLTLINKENGVIFKLTISQTTTRYRDHGTFEEVLDKVMKNSFKEA